ncbi:hypothetical protein SAY86_030982 [Trapa natans]|uniref:Serine-threonine/tyrosine-protein kinase catalytic domain-containing protein n=1 Tax=Trapa natans TaxID=22666 RepID=A0AAN7M3T2_TRANT|nr:hypothetical protein SAY86_030982 [Trapa natans]
MEVWVSFDSFVVKFEPGHLTARSDVYGFGVVLLELLIGRGAMEKNKPSQDHSLVEWARPILNNKKLPRILDPYGRPVLDRSCHGGRQVSPPVPQPQPQVEAID